MDLCHEDKQLLLEAMMAYASQVNDNGQSARDAGDEGAVSAWADELERCVAMTARIQAEPVRLTQT